MVYSEFIRHLDANNDNGENMKALDKQVAGI